MYDKTILFDLDGTLINSTKAIINSFNFAFNNKNNSIPNENDIKSLIGYTLEDIFANLGVEHSDIKEYIYLYKQNYQKIYLSQTILLDKVLLALNIAYNFADLGVVTTKTSKFSNILLKHLNIYKFFKIIIGKEDVKNPKPSAEPIQKALKLLNKNTKNAFMIGDTHLDLKAAINANITPIALTCEYGDKNSFKDFTCNIFDNVFEAVNFIKEI